MEWASRLQAAFEEKGWSAAELARRSDVPYDSVKKYLAGKVKQPRGDTLDRLADALGVERLYLKEGLDTSAATRQVRLMGYVGAGQTIEAIPLGEDETIDAPADARDGTVAAQVRGDSMLPIFRDGWVLYWSRKLPPSEMVNETAIVQLADGRIMVKQIRMGSRPGLWTLASANASDVVDVVIDWAAPIDWIRPARFR